jgi:hypothetical protein
MCTNLRFTNISLLLPENKNISKNEVTTFLSASKINLKLIVTLEEQTHPTVSVP